MHLRHRLYSGRNTLMTMAASQFGQSHTVSFNEANTSLLGTFDELTHARIAASGFKVNFNDRLRRCFKAHTHRVKSKQNFG
jgi:hypothetical protein